MKAKKPRTRIKDLPVKCQGRADQRDVKGGTEWNYAPVQRYFATMQPSLQKDTTWIVYNGGKG